VKLGFSDRLDMSVGEKRKACETSRHEDTDSKIINKMPLVIK
jgi:hypothetical protein